MPTDRLRVSLQGIAQFRHFEKINGFTVLIPRVENQIDYHTCNSSALRHLPNKGGLLVTMEVTKLCESVKPFPDPRSPKLSDAHYKTLAEAVRRGNVEIVGVDAEGWRARPAQS
jgi:hypothetical protein